MHLSFTKNDLDLYQELLRESCLTHVPTSVLVRNYLRTAMSLDSRITFS